MLGKVWRENTVNAVADGLSETIIFTLEKEERTRRLTGAGEELPIHRWRLFLMRALLRRDVGWQAWYGPIFSPCLALAVFSYV